MISIEASQLSAKDQYKILIGSVIPRPIAFLSTLSAEGIVNLAPFSFYNIVSYDPAILSVSIQRKNGQPKDTTINILERGEAVIHSVSSHNLEAVNQAAKELGHNESELNLTGMTMIDSSTIRTPGVKESAIRFETKLYQHVPIKGADEQIIADLLLLSIQAYHLEDALYQKTHVLADQLDPISRLAGNDYAKLGQTLTIPRP